MLAELVEARHYISRPKFFFSTGPLGNSGGLFIKTYLVYALMFRGYSFLFQPLPSSIKTRWGHYLLESHSVVNHELNKFSVSFLLSQLSLARIRRGEGLLAFAYFISTNGFMSSHFYIYGLAEVVSPFIYDRNCTYSVNHSKALHIS